MSTANIVGTGDQVLFSWYKNFLGDSGSYIVFNTGSDTKLTELTLYCAAVTNLKYPFIHFQTGKVLAKQGALTSKNIKLTVKVTGADGNEYTSNEQAITHIAEFKGVDTIAGTTGYTATISVVESVAPVKFTFPAPAQPILKANSSINLTFVVSGVSGSVTTSNGCLAIGFKDGVIAKKGTATLEAATIPLNSFKIKPTNAVTITNTSQQTTGSGVNKNYKDTSLHLEYNPANADINSINVTSTNETTCTVANRNITVTSRSNTIENISNTLTITVNDKSQNLTVNYYRDPKQEPIPKILSNILDCNISNITPYAYNGYTPSSDNYAYGSKGAKLFFDGNAVDGSFTLSDIGLDVSKYLNISSPDSNFSVSNEDMRHTLTWRFYNSDVQEATSNGTYKYDVTTYITYSITPDDINQFSCEGEDDLPNTVLVNQDFKTVRNLIYTNESTSGGFCRGFRIQFLDSNNRVVNTKYLNVGNTSGSASYTGDAFSATDFNNVPEKQLITIEITPYFYYNNSTNTRYFGESYFLKQKYLKIKTEDLLPSVVFPIDYFLEKGGGVSGIKLSQITRVGYNFDDFILSSGLFSELKFGISISNTIDFFSVVYLDSSNLDYFSSQNITKHLIFNLGKYITDNPKLQDQIIIVMRPFIEIQNKRIMQDYGNPSMWFHTYSMWNRPVVTQGTKITYHDYDNFKYIIDKYVNLVDSTVSEKITSSKQNSGNTITVKFWKDIADLLDIYATNMQNWATDVTNLSVPWVLPEFKHKQGEVITAENLYQNYYDLLIQFDESSRYATYDYLKDNEYTHDYLHNYTHDQITNKEMQ